MCGFVIITDSTGASTSTVAATSGPTRRPNTSRSASTPSKVPSGAVTKKESPVPVRWIVRRHAPIDVPGDTVTGSRRPISRSGTAASVGTRAATARSVRSATARVYADTNGDAVARTRHPGTLGLVDRVRLTGVALIVVSAFAFGSGGLFARPVYDMGVDWLTLMAWRFGIAGTLAWAVVLARPASRAAVRSMSRPALLGAVGLGVFYLSNTATYYAGIALVPLSLAALIVYIYPPVVAVLALRLGRPLEGRRAWTALGIAVAGVVLAVGGISASAMPPIEGLLLVIVSPLFYSVWIILAARHSGERSDRTGPRVRGRRRCRGDRRGDAVRHRDRVLGDQPCAGAPGAAVHDPGGGVGRDPGRRGDRRVPGDPGVLRGGGPGGRGAGVADLDGRAAVDDRRRVPAVRGAAAPVQWLGGAMILAGVILAQTRGRPGAASSTDETPPLPQPAVHLSEE